MYFILNLTALLGGVTCSRQGRNQRRIEHLNRKTSSEGIDCKSRAQTEENIRRRSLGKTDVNVWSGVCCSAYLQLTCSDPVRENMVPETSKNNERQNLRVHCVCPSRSCHVCKIMQHINCLGWQGGQGQIAAIQKGDGTIKPNTVGVRQPSCLWVGQWNVNCQLI